MGIFPSSWLAFIYISAQQHKQRFLIILANNPHLLSKGARIEHVITSQGQTFQAPDKTNIS